MPKKKIKIKYQKGYNYQLVEEYRIKLPIFPVKDVKTNFIEMTTGGYLFIKKGYAWDGATRAIDTKSFIRGSLVHDALYQLMRQHYLGESWRKEADKALKHICRADGMWKVRAWWVYKAVRLMGKISKPRKILTAP